MDSYDKIIAVFIGVLLGGIFSAVGYYVKIVNEKNKVLNSTLYELILIFNSALFETIKDEHYFLNGYFLKKRSILIPTESEIRLVKKKHKKWLNIIGDSDIKGSDSLLTKYNELVNKVSEQDPVLALNLSIKTDPIQKIEKIRGMSPKVSVFADDSWKEVWNKFEINEEVEGMIAAQFFVDQAHDEIDKIMSIVFLVAKKIDRKTKKEVDDYINSFLNIKKAAFNSIMEDIVNEVEKEAC